MSFLLDLLLTTLRDLLVAVLSSFLTLPVGALVDVLAAGAAP